MSKTIIDVKHLELGGRESLEIAVTMHCSFDQFTKALRCGDEWESQAYSCNQYLRRLENRNVPPYWFYIISKNLSDIKVFTSESGCIKLHHNYMFCTKLTINFLGLSSQ